MQKLSKRLKIYECIGNMYPEQIMEEIQGLEDAYDRLLIATTTGTHECEYKDKAANWDMLEKLPDGLCFIHVFGGWCVPLENNCEITLKDSKFEETPAEALNKYWESK
jgi:hypothetical protein